MKTPTDITRPDGRLNSAGKPFTKTGHFDLGVAVRDDVFAGGRLTGNVETIFDFPAQEGQSGLDGYFSADRPENYDSELAEFPVNPEAYTPQSFLTQFEMVMQDAYTEAGMKVLDESSKYSGLEKRQFRSQRIYDTMVQNPPLLEYFKEFYPAFIEDMSEKFVQDEVVVGRGDQGQRIIAGREFTQPFNLNPLIKTMTLPGEADPFDFQDIERKVDSANKLMFGLRAAYGVAEAVGATGDFLATPKERVFEMLSTYGEVMHASPSRMAEWHNWMFRNNLIEDAMNIKYRSRGPLFTEEEIKNMTWEKLSTSQNAVTFSDLLFNDVGRVFSSLGVKNKNNYGIKVAPMGLGGEPATPEAAIAGPGIDPVGQGSTGLGETAAGMLVGIGAFRLVVEAGKSTVRKASRFFDKGTGEYNWGAHYASIDKQMSESATIFGRGMAAMRRGSADTSRAVGRTVAMEEAYALASLYSTDQFTKMGFIENPTQNLIVSMFVGFAAPVLGMGTGKFVGDFGYRQIQGFTDKWFDPQFAELAEVLSAGTGNTTLGRNIERDLGKTLSSLKVEDPETFELLMRGHVAFTQNKQSILDGLTEVGTDPATVERLGELISGSFARGTTLSMIDAARHAASTQGNFGFGKVIRGAFNVAGGKRWGSSLENDISKSAQLERLHQSQQEGVRAYGEILSELTVELTKLENSGAGVPKAMRDMAIRMRGEHSRILGLPEGMLLNVQDALLDVYDINRKMGLPSNNPDKISKGDAEKQLQAAFDRLPENEQVLFADEVNNQFFSGTDNQGYKGIVGLLGEMQGIKKVIGEQQELVGAMHGTLQRAGHLTSSNELAAGRPRYGSTRKKQTTLMDQVYDENKRQSDANYTALYAAAGDEPAVAARELIVAINTKIQDLGLNYGTGGLEVAQGVLSDLSRSNPSFNQLVKLMGRAMDDPDGPSPSAETIEKLSEALQPLTLKEAVQFRSELNSEAYKLSKLNNSDSRRGAAILHDMSSIISTRIEYAAPAGSELDAGLRNANKFYRENVADLFFDRYVRSSLRSDTNVTSPFETAFSQATLRRMQASEESAAEGEIIEAVTQTRRDLYDRMFPEGSDLRTQADNEMRNLMLRRLYGESETTSPTRVEFVKRLRTLTNSANSPLFQMREEGGFLDILLRSDSEAKEFLRLSDVAPTVKSNARGDDVLSGNMRRMLGRTAGDTLVSDPLFNNFTQQGNSEAIGRIFKRVIATARDTAEIDMSPTLGIFADLFEGKRDLGGVADELLKKILDRTDKSGASLNSRQTYLGLLEDVRAVYPDVDGQPSEQLATFKAAMQAKIVDSMVQKSTAVGAIDSTKAGIKTQRIEAIGFQDLRQELEAHGPLYREVLGESSYEGVVGLIKIASVSDNATDLLEYSQGLNKMTESAALSRMWGVARGVVSLKYVGSEWLLRNLASGKNKALVEILSTPGLAEYVLDGVDAGRARYSPYAAKMVGMRRLIPLMVGVLSEGESREHHEKTAQALFNLLQATNATEDDSLQDFALNLVSLAMAVRNTGERERLLGIAGSN
jgi:hypothetical protein